MPIDLLELADRANGAAEAQRQLEVARIAAIVASGLVQTNEWGIKDADDVAETSVQIAEAILERVARQS